MITNKSNHVKSFLQRNSGSYIEIRDGLKDSQTRVRIYFTDQNMTYGSD